MTAALQITRQIDLIALAQQVLRGLRLAVHLASAPHTSARRSLRSCRALRFGRRPQTQQRRRKHTLGTASLDGRVKRQLGAGHVGHDHRIELCR